MKTLAWTMALALAGAPGVPAGKGLSADEARDRIYAWEREVLAKWPKGQDAARDQAIRTFFAKLDDPQLKLAAIGATNSRYVYEIPRRLVPELMKPLLSDASPEVRARALDSLAYNGAAGSCFDEVVAIFKASDGDLFARAAAAMRRSRDVRFVPYLRPLLRHADGMIRADAVMAFLEMPDATGALRTEAMALWNDPHPQVRYTLLNRTDITSPQGEAWMRESARHTAPHVRQLVAERLADGKTAYALELLASLMRDDDAHVRGRAIEGLARQGAKAHADAVLARALDVKEDLFVRRTAVTAMASLGAARHLTAIQGLTNDSDQQVRGSAAATLRTLGVAR